MRHVRNISKESAPSLAGVQVINPFPALRIISLVQLLGLDASKKSPNFNPPGDLEDIG
jgi:hypothetical protein